MCLTLDTKYTKNLSELNKDSLPEAGGKGANLSEKSRLHGVQNYYLKIM